MVDLIELKKQIIKLADKTKIRSAKKMQGNDQVGALSYIIKNAVLQSDVRMYKREVFAYNGKHYEHIDGMMFAKMLIDIMEELAFGFGFIVAHRKKVIDFVIDNLIQKDITPERFIIPFNNCLLNTKTMEKLKHSPDHDILYCLKYDYDEKADCPL